MPTKRCPTPISGEHPPNTNLNLLRRTGLDAHSSSIGTHSRSLRCIFKASSGRRIQPEGAAVRTRTAGQTALSAAPNRCGA
eukprot:7361317-Alexandrium_andersonii.AAC.1